MESAIATEPPANAASLPDRRLASSLMAGPDFIHTGPGTLAGRYLRMFWQPVYQASRLRTGRAVPLKIMSEEYTLYRGESGTPYITAPRCPHRLTRLSTGKVEGEDIRCFYHGWKFDGSGQCLEMPAEPPGSERRLAIRSYPVREYLGLIFAYLGEGEPPEFPRYPHIEGPGEPDWFVHLRPINYFTQIDNVVDPAHTPFTHAGAGFLENGVVGVPRVEGHENEWGIIQYGRRPNGEVRVNHFGMPNIFHNKFVPTSAESGWQELIVWCVPVDDTSHINFRVTLAHVEGEAAERFRKVRDARNALMETLPAPHLVAASIVAGETTLDMYLDRPDIVAIQDLVTQIGQDPIPDRTQERLGRSDVLVVMARRIYQRELAALEQGLPLKQWRWMPDLVAAAGDERAEP